MVCRKSHSLHFSMATRPYVLICSMQISNAESIVEPWPNLAISGLGIDGQTGRRDIFFIVFLQSLGKQAFVLFIITTRLCQTEFLPRNSDGTEAPQHPHWWVSTKENVGFTGKVGDSTSRNGCCQTETVIYLPETMIVFYGKIDLINVGSQGSMFDCRRVNVPTWRVKPHSEPSATARTEFWVNSNIF